MDKGFDDSLPSSEQQQAQHTLTIYLSRASALLTEYLTKPDIIKERIFGELAMLLQKISRGMATEVDKNQSLDDLFLQIGSKESTQKKEPLSMVLAALSCKDKPQRIPSGTEITLVGPSILPGIFVLQIQRPNGGPINRYQEFFLVGRKRLPKDYQEPLTPRI